MEEQLMENVVISGISGRFPQSNNVWAFRDHLLNGDDMVTEDSSRWPLGLWGLPRRSGKLKDLSKFDASFFGVHAKQAHAMTPQLRKLLEVTYEAIFDAGFNPESLRGSNTGVFIGVSTVDYEDGSANDPETISGFEVTGFHRCMFSNRISFTFDFKGPSLTIDTGCSSSLTALNQALLAIRSGECDSCIVGGSNLCMNPIVTLQFQRLGLLSSDGKCKSFDSEGFGFVRSEAVVCLFLQRSSLAKRIYAEVIHCKLNNDGYKEKGPTYPSAEVQEELLRRVYKEAGVDPAQVVYVEADGTGTKAGDSEEIFALRNVFCENFRPSPLLIGSVKSNMGHAEAASGLCGIIKVLIAAEAGILPQNLHFRNPINGLRDDKIKVVVENIEWNGGLVGVSSIGFGGLNAHVILYCFGKTKKISLIYELTIFPSCGRTAKSVDAMLKFMKDRNTTDVYNLFVDITDKPPHNYVHRGYTILNSMNATTKVKELSNEKLSICYIFSGFGSQWLGMGVDLMRVDVFKRSIMKSHEILLKFNINLYDLIVKATVESQNNLINVFVLITSIQVALVDLLTHLGVEPDKIIGHSLGETACGYADRCLTHEQTILAAYWRGKCVLDINPPKGIMAIVVGLTWDETRNLCPPGVEAVCHNIEKSITVAGDKISMKAFMKELESRKIFVKKIDTLNVAFHCELIKSAAPKLLKALQELIPDPKPRSSRWISSSVPKDMQDSTEAKLASANYFVNNLLNAVLFHDALSRVEKDAIMIEIAPHGLLLPLISQSLSEKNICISFAKRTELNNYQFFLVNMGKLYVNGVNCALRKLFPPQNHPLSYGISTISPLVHWNHEDDWNVATLDHFLGVKKIEGTKYEVNLSSHDSLDHYLIGHVIDGELIYPIAGYLIFAWKEIATVKSKIFDRMVIEFKNVLFHRPVVLTKNEVFKFFVTVSETEESFIIREKGTIVCTGHFYLPEYFPKPFPSALPLPIISNSTYLNSKDVYKKLELGGYKFGPPFQGIVNAQIDGTTGSLKWFGNWLPFIDSMLQFSLTTDIHTHIRIVGLGYVKIDPNVHLLQRNRNFLVTMDPVLKKYTSGGIEISRIKSKIVERKEDIVPIVEEHHFVPYFDNNCFAMSPYLECEIAAYYLECINEVKNGIKKWMQNDFAQTSKLEAILKQVISISDNNDDTRETEMPLINNLREIVSLPMKSEQEMKSLINSVMNNSSTDVCLDSYLQPIFMKPFLDIVRDNNVGNQLVIAEANARRGRMAQQIVKLFKSQPLMQVNYIITTRLRNELPAVDPMTFSVDSWDFESCSLSTSVDFIVGRNILNKSLDENQQILKNIMDSLKNDGFALLIQLKASNPLVQFVTSMGEFEVNAEEQLIMLMENVGFQVISVRSDGFLNDAYLIRKVVNKLATVLRIDESIYDLWVEELKTKLREVNSSTTDMTLWLVSNDQPNCGVIGLVSYLRRNANGKRIRCIFNTSFTESKSSVDIAKDICIKDLVMNVYRDERWGFFSQLPFTPDPNPFPTKHAFADVLTLGDVSSLRWFESPLKFNETASNVCTVYYAGLNFRDLLYVVDGISASDDQSYHIGMEFAGRNIEGQRVMGVLPYSALATTVEFDSELTWMVPDGWSLEEAATIPVVYTTVYYALIVRGKLQQEEAVLIHYGSGSVGQVAIRLALSLKCCVFTTVASEEKKKCLMKSFPQLKNENFIHFRDTSFEDHVLRATNGKGVDVILNSFSEDKFESNIQCLAYGGRFLEIGNRNTFENRHLGMSSFIKNVSFHGVFTDGLFEKLTNDKKTVAALVKEGIKSGVVQPLNFTVFEEDQLEDAFRFMNLRKHFGKVLIRLRDEEIEKVTSQSAAIAVLALAKCLCHPSKSYIIVEGLTGLGLQIGDWLVEKGAKFLFLASRTNISNKYLEFCLFKWKQLGVDVKISVKNLVALQGTRELVKEAIASQGAIGGIFNLISGSNNELRNNSTAEQFKSVFDLKILSTRNLDIASRHLCPSLDWFVVFGKRNTEFADSAVERICERRKHDLFPALVIQWGEIENVEYGQADKMHHNDSIGVPQRISSCLSTLEKFLSQKHPVVSSFVSPQSQSELNPIIPNKSLLDVVTNIFGISDTKILTSDSSLIDLGIDSIIGLEIKQTLEKNYSLNLSKDEIRRLTIGELRNFSQAQSGDSIFSSKIWSSANINNYDINELVPVDCIVKLNSLNNSLATPVFFVHSVEGNISMFKTLAKQLLVPVYGIQFTSTVPKNNISEMAHFYIIEMQKIQTSPPYNLASYSEGCVIIFEMALQLQNLYYSLDAIHVLLFLEGSHCPISNPFLQSVEADDQFLQSDDLFQDSILSYFLFHFAQFDPVQVNSSLRHLPTLVSKTEYVVEAVMNLGLPCKRDLIRTAAHMFFTCADLVRVYHPEEKLKSPVVLLRATNNDFVVNKLGVDYSLGKVCWAPVRVEMIDGDHEMFLQEQSIDQIGRLISTLL